METNQMNKVQKTNENAIWFIAQKGLAVEILREDLAADGRLFHREGDVRIATLPEWRKILERQGYTLLYAIVSFNGKVEAADLCSNQRIPVPENVDCEKWVDELWRERVLQIRKAEREKFQAEQKARKERILARINRGENEEAKEAQLSESEEKYFYRGGWIAKKDNEYEYQSKVFIRATTKENAEKMIDHALGFAFTNPCGTPNCEIKRIFSTKWEVYYNGKLVAITQEERTAKNVTYFLSQQKEGEEK